MTSSFIKDFISVFLFFASFCNGYSQTKEDFIGVWEFYNSDKTLKIKLEFGTDKEGGLYGNFFSANIGSSMIKESIIANSTLAFKAILGTDFRISGKIIQIENDYQCSIDVNGKKYELAGKRLTKETNNKINYSEPSWSPDGQFIITSFEQFGKMGIKLLSKKGDKWTELWSIENAQRAQFSNDGSKVAYVSYFSTMDELWTIEIGTSEKSQITTNKAGIDLIEWSKDDQTILFSSSEGPYLVDLNSNAKSKLYDKQTPSYYARYSPDNKFVLFTSTLDNIYDIKLYNIEKNNELNISNNKMPDFNQQINRNGQIIWISTRDGNSEIYTTRLNDLDNLIRLTNNSHRDNNPSFSYDGDFITWVSRNENPEIFMMNSDGTNQVNLTNNGANDTNPIFNPVGGEILFLSDRDGQHENFIIDLKKGSINKVLTK